MRCPHCDGSDLFVDSGFELFSGCHWRDLYCPICARRFFFEVETGSGGFVVLHISKRVRGPRLAVFGK